MTFSLAIHFFSHSLVYDYRALYNALHRRYLIECWNFWYGLRVKRKENDFCIRKCNNMKNNYNKQNSKKIEKKKKKKINLKN